MRAEAAGYPPPLMSSGLGLPAEPSPFTSLRRVPGVLGCGALRSSEKQGAGVFRWRVTLPAGRVGAVPFVAK